MNNDALMQQYLFGKTAFPTAQTACDAAPRKQQTLEQHLKQYHGGQMPKGDCKFLAQYKKDHPEEFGASQGEGDVEGANKGANADNGNGGGSRHDALLAKIPDGGIRQGVSGENGFEVAHSTEEGKVNYGFHAWGWMFDTNSQLEAAGVFAGGDEKVDPDISALPIDDFDDDDVREAAYWITGGNRTWSANGGDEILGGNWDTFKDALTKGDLGDEIREAANGAKDFGDLIAKFREMRKGDAPMMQIYDSPEYSDFQTEKCEEEERGIREDFEGIKKRAAEYREKYPEGVKEIEGLEKDIEDQFERYGGSFGGYDGAHEIVDNARELLRQLDDRDAEDSEKYYEDNKSRVWEEDADEFEKNGTEAQKAKFAAVKADYDELKKRFPILQSSGVALRKFNGTEFVRNESPMFRFDTKPLYTMGDKQTISQEDFMKVGAEMQAFARKNGLVAVAHEKSDRGQTYMFEFGE